MDSVIKDRIQRFTQDLGTLTTSGIVDKHILGGSPYALHQDQYYQLRDEISRYFKIHANQIELVGSAKLGFSIKPRKRYMPFSDESDIDVAIVSDALFDLIWGDVFDYVEAGGTWERRQEFEKYLFRGWIRPDVLPSASRFQRSRDWMRFFDNLSSSRNFGMYKIRGGLYRTWHFLQSYHCICVKQCEMETGISL
jgi:hypothetical protein